MRSFALLLIPPSIAFTSVPAAAEELCRVWQDRTYEVPFPRGEGEIVYDSWRDVIVFVGPGEGYWGGDGWSYPMETWEWDGNSWTQRMGSGPDFRRGFSLVFDKERGVAVFFGGSNGEGLLPGTWEWDGASWQLRNAGEPPGQFGVFDSVRNKVLSLSGEGGLWTWDGSAWTANSSVGGPTRAQGMVFDSARGLLLVFTRANIWTWDGQEWAETEWTLPLDSDPRCAVFDKHRGETIVFDPLGSTLALNENGWTFLTEHSNRAYYDQYYSRLVYDEHRLTTLSYEYMAYQVGLFELDASQWRPVATTEPGPRWLQAMIYDSLRHETLMFGGSTVGSHYLGDTWSWNGVAWQLRNMGGPSARQSSAVAFDSTRGVSVLFGGRGEWPSDVTAHCCSLEETWEWDGTKWNYIDVQGPGKRFGHAMIYDEARAVTMLFGGYYQPVFQEPYFYYGDTWLWNGTTWSEIPVEGPSPRLGHLMAYDPIRRATVLYGARNQVTYDAQPRDTWEWDGAAWANKDDGGPVQKAEVMYFDAFRGRVVMFGQSTNYERGAWAWEGGHWRFLGSADLFPPSACGAYDTRRDVGIFFGGIDGGPHTFSNELWEYQLGSIPADCDSDCDVDLLDFAVLQTCVGDMSADAACGQLDVDGSGWVDAADFAELFEMPTGPSEPSN